jgi:hypothetical protein
MYDIIGDIHGHADELVELLTKLGYSESSGHFRHPSRQVVFCGDFIDRGPHIPDVVRIARSMVEHGSALAVMGNHEFNALAYHTPDKDRPGAFLRPHDQKNKRQHAQTVQQFEPADLQQALDWFRTLPASLDLPGLRVVHACWHPEHLKIIEHARSELGAGTFEFLREAMNPASQLFAAVECVMKGPELTLPDGLTVEDKEGNRRRRIRIRWFECPAQKTWGQYSLPAKSGLPEEFVPASAAAIPYPEDAPPVFVGHYWLPEKSPAPLKQNVACLDYSVAKHGMLCGYRFDGETRLKSEHFVTVPSRHHGAPS